VSILTVHLPDRVLASGTGPKSWVLRLEFKTFVRLPCQVVRTGRTLRYRLLSWDAHPRIFFRWVQAPRC
jgi:hypothetical protein